MPNENDHVSSLFDEFMNSESFKSQEKLLEERKRTVKHGPNVIHLEHLGQFSEIELNELDAKLKTVGIELSSFNKSGIFMNMLDEYLLVSYFVMHSQLISQVITSLGVVFPKVGHLNFVNLSDCRRSST